MAESADEERQLFALTVPARSDPAPSVQDNAQEEPASLRPGEYANYSSKSPYAPAISKESREFDEKYLFGDWLGAGTELANLGIEPTILFIVDPFGGVTGGRQRGFTE